MVAWAVKFAVCVGWRDWSGVSWEAASTGARAPVAAIHTHPFTGWHVPACLSLLSTTYHRAHSYVSHLGDSFQRALPVSVVHASTHSPFHRLARAHIRLSYTILPWVFFCIFLTSLRAGSRTSHSPFLWGTCVILSLFFLINSKFLYLNPMLRYILSGRKFSAEISAY